MQSKWSVWATKLAEAGKGGFPLKSIDRGLPYSVTLGFSADFSADTFSASLHSGPDAAGAGTALSVSVGSFTSGQTPVTLSLTKTEVDALAADTDNLGFVTLVYDILHTPNGGEIGRIMGGEVDILGNVTDAA